MTRRQAVLDQLMGKPIAVAGGKQDPARDAEGPSDPNPEEPVEEAPLSLGKRFSLPKHTGRKKPPTIHPGGPPPFRHVKVSIPKEVGPLHPVRKSL